jgi:hypothetical protein
MQNNIITSKALMIDFAQRTGLTDSKQFQNRYLWTDAFAVCNFLQLYLQTKNEKHKE